MLWHDHDVRRLWTGQTLSQLGEHTALVILPLTAVLTLDAGPAGLGALRAVGQAPLLLLPLLAGAWVDRWRTRTVMTATDLARALVLGAAATTALLGGLGLPALFAAVFAVGALCVLFDVAYQTCVVRLVPAARRTAVNSALEGSRSAAQTGGPALGGALATLAAAPVALAACALLFALSGLSIGRVRRPERLPAHPVRRRLPRQVHEGLRFVAREPALRTVCLASAAFQCAAAATMTVQLLFLPRELGLSGVAVGLALAATGPGAVLGSVLAARLPRRFGHGPVLVLAAALGDGALLGVPALHGPAGVTFPLLLAIQFVFGAGGQLVNVTVLAVRQALTPDGLQARAAATITFAGMGLSPFGSLLGGALAGAVGLRTAFALTAAALLLSPAVLALSPLARLGRDLPRRARA